MTFSKSLKTIIIDDFHPVLLEKLTNGQIDFHYLPDISKEEAIRSISHYQIIITRSKLEFSKELLESLTQLKCIARGGAGLDNIDELYAKEKGITLLNAPEGNRDAVAEHAIGIILSLSNNIVKSTSEVKEKLWHREANRGFEIGGKTLGIIGFGNTGQALARKLNGFGCKVIAYDKYFPSLNPDIESVELDELLSRADIISLHIPLTAETTDMINYEFIEKCKKGLMLINTSRGKILNENDVLKALEENKIGYFGTDVLMNENFNSYSYEELQKFDALVQKSNVIITPHIAGWTKESYQKISEVLADKVLDFTTK